MLDATPCGGYEIDAGVNTLELLKLADFMERCQLKFQMEDGFAKPECGTAGCILGHAALMWKKGNRDYSWVSKSEFSERLGLTREQSRFLCFAPHFATQGMTYTKINNDPAIAVRAVRHLALTGEVSFV